MKFHLLTGSTSCELIKTTRHPVIPASTTAFPTSPGRKALEQHVWRGLNGQEDGAVVLCQPGEVDDRLRRSEPRAAQEARQAQLDFLRSQAFSLLIVEKDIFLY